MVLYNMEKVFLEHWNFSRKRANITMTDTENVTSVGARKKQKSIMEYVLYAGKTDYGSESQNYGSG